MEKFRKNKFERGDLVIANKGKYNEFVGTVEDFYETCYHVRDDYETLWKIEEKYLTLYLGLI